MKPKVLAVIPARYGSTRFPGKVLTPIAGKPLIEHIYRDVEKSSAIDLVAVATDSKEIRKAVEDFGGLAVMTSKRHRTGSDRVAEAAEVLGGNIIVNIQGDHLGVAPKDFTRVIKAMKADRKIKYASVAYGIKDSAEIDDPNRVKVVVGADGYALWFSRYAIPFVRGATGKTRLAHFKFRTHVGVYFFRRAALRAYAGWTRTPAEKAESLEQLRILEHGEKIKLFDIKSHIYSVDTPGDLKQIDSKRFLK